MDKLLLNVPKSEDFHKKKKEREDYENSQEYKDKKLAELERDKVYKRNYVVTLINEFLNNPNPKKPVLNIPESLLCEQDCKDLCALLKSKGYKVECGSGRISLSAEVPVVQPTQPVQQTPTVVQETQPVQQT